MKTSKTITKLTMTIGMAVLAAAGILCSANWLQRVEAQSGDGSVKFIAYGAIGFAPGEKIRVTVRSSAGSASPNLMSTTGWFRYSLTDPFGVTLYQSEPIKVASGEFRSSDVSRGDLKTEGELGTGRAEVMLRATIEPLDGSNPDDFRVSTEVINEQTGATSSGPCIHEFGHFMDTNSEAASVGFSHGERLSVTVFSPPDTGTPVRTTTYVYDGIGRTIARSAEVELRPDQSYTFAFNRDELPEAGEEKTGRLQVHAVVQVAMLDGSVRSVRLPVWVAVVNNRTGSTTSGGNYFCGTVTVSGD